MNGVIFNIQKYSLHDGPGIRTVVFLKGCPLRCKWCCNPESQRFEPEMMYKESPEQVGYEISEETLFDLILKDRSFYRRSGGGVTLSGGEALCQPEFVKEVLRLCYDSNIHTALETTGYADWKQFEKILPYTDLFLYDIKHMDSAVHKQLTGVSNETILSNLKKLAKTDKAIVIRLPLIKKYNATEENLHTLACFMNQNGINNINIMPFHQLGKEKYRYLQREYELEQEEGLMQSESGQAFVEASKSLLESYGINVQIGG